MQSCKWTSRFIAFGLTFIMVFQLVPKQLMIRANSVELIPEIPVIRENEGNSTLSVSSVEVMGEMVEKRGPNVKYFRMSDGSYQVAQYAYDVHYQTQTGFEEYDNTLKNTNADSKGNFYTPTKSNMQIAFAQNGIENGIFRFGNGDYSIQVAMVELPNLEIASASSTVTQVNKQVAATIQTKSTTENYASKLDALTDMGKTVSGLSYKDILPDTTLEYVLFGNNVKESIILSAPPAQNRWRFKLTLNGVTAVLQENGDIYFVKDSSEEIACIIPKGYMFDAKNRHSDNVTYSLTPCADGVYLTIQADFDWLKDSSRVYPVTIDPTFWNGSEGAITVKDAHVIQANPNLNTGLYNILRTGYDTDPSFNNMRIYLKWNSLPTLPDSAEVIAAKLRIKQVPSGNWYSYGGGNSYTHIGVYKVLGNWEDTTITWNNQPSTDTNVMDYVTTTNATATQVFQLNITQAVRGWYSDPNSNYGVVLHAEPESWSGHVGFHSGNDTSVTDAGKPSLLISYRDTRGLENIWSYDVEDVGTAGTGYVNLFNGNLVFVQPGITTAGNILPLQVGLVYNDFQKGMHFNKNEANINAPYTLSTPVKTGYGWKLNLLETIRERRTDTGVSTYENWLVYNDGNGTEIYFKDYVQNYIDVQYQSEDGHPLTITKTDEGYVLEDDQHNKKIFDHSGRLFALEDFSGNRKEIEFNTAGYPTKVKYYPAEETVVLTDLLFEYNANGALVKIINGRDTTKYVEYLYANTHNGTAQTGASNYLVGVRYSTGEEAAYCYTTTSALGLARDVTNKKEVWYSYGSGRVTDIEVTYENSLLEDERYITYKEQKTIVRTRGVDDMPLTEDDYLNIYLFDTYGRAVNVYVTDITEEKIYGTSYTAYNNGSNQNDIRKQNTIASQTMSGNVAQNLVRNGNAESLTQWTSSVPSGGTASVEADAYYGEKSLSLFIDRASPGTGTFTQAIYQATNSGVYTLSAYVKTADVTPYSQTAGAKICLNDQSSLCLTGFSDYDLGWERLVVSRYYTAGETITVQLKLENSSGIAYFDAIQLEAGESVSAYNLIENGSFMYGSTTWDLSGGYVYTGSYGKYGNGASIPGSLYHSFSMSQTVAVNQASSSMALMVSGWAKGKSAAREGSSIVTGNINYAQRNRYFALQVLLKYSDNTTETHYVDFSPVIWNEWQFVAKAIHPEKPNMVVTSVTVSPCAGFNKCDAYFDNISVTIEPTAVYSYDTKGNMVEVGEANGNSQYMDYTQDSQLSSYQPYLNDETYDYEYYYSSHIFKYQLERAWSPSGICVCYDDYDYYGNLLEKTTYSAADDYEVLDTYTYDYYGNFLQTETNSHGSTTYDYNEATGVLNYVQNANQNRTGYVYDVSGKLTAVFLDQDKDGTKDSGEQSVQYLYDSQNRLIRIQTAGESYNFVYNYYDQVTSITVGNRATPLATYTYNARGGKLIRTDYGDGTYITNTYDDYGRISAVSYNGTVAYTVVYDGDGNVFSYTETASGYQYLYDYDNIGRIRQYRILSDGDCIVQVAYVYREDGRIASISKTYGSMPYFTYYQYNQYGQLTRINMDNGKPMLFTYDGLDRLSKRTANHGNGQVHTEYTYWTSGTYTTNRITSIKYKTDSQTLTTIQYAYDSLGNITRVNDGTETRLYTYDALNQLTSEIIYKNSTGVGTKATYSYDQSGNIVSKTQSVYNNGTVSNSTTVNYTYGDATWGDLLTGYDGEGISYDAIGNPLSYYNGKRYTFSWLYGRRLASIVVDGKTTTYTYNTEGLRMTKTVDGVVHTYYWDGSTLLMEKWGNSYLRFLYDESGAPLRVEYYNGSTTTVYYYVLNLQGDVLEIRDTANNVVCRYSYDAWGKLLSVKDGSGNAIASATHIGILNPLRYRGYYYDTETGLYYLQSRYYDPQVGRFISPDTYISTGQGMLGYNMYAYCANNPVNMDDADGNWPKWLKKAAKAAITVIAAAVVVTAVVASAGAVGVAAGVAAASVGATGTMVSAAITVGTVGTYAVATGIGACTLSNAGEILTGTNVIRDGLMGGNQETYETVQTVLNIAGGGAMIIGQTNPGVTGNAAKPSQNAQTVHKVPTTGTANTSFDKLYGGNAGGFQRTYYDFKGNVSLQIDFTYHNNSSIHSNPHLHIWGSSGRGNQINLWYLE